MSDEEVLISELRQCMLELVSIVEVIVGAEVKEPSVYDHLKQRIVNLRRRI